MAACHLPTLADETSEQNKFSAQGYRITHYRGSIESAPFGTSLINTGQLARWLVEGTDRTIAVNVLPVTWLYGQFIVTDDVLHIPGSIWLPNVGFGELDELWHSYFESSLKQLRAQHPKARIVFYCKANCWHAWNAAKRSVDLGYNEIYWYNQGMEGWVQAEFATVSCSPDKLNGGKGSELLSVCLQ